MTAAETCDLAAIRSRRDRARNDDDTFAADELVARDVPALAAEVEALRAERDRLVERVRALRDDMETLTRTRPTHFDGSGDPVGDATDEEYAIMRQAGHDPACAAWREGCRCKPRPATAGVS